MAFWLAFGKFLFTLAVQIAINEFLVPGPEFENARPIGLDQFNFPTASQDRHVPIIWGKVLVSGPNVTWYGDYSRTPIKKEIPTGLFSDEEIITGYQYKVGMQLSISRGPIDGISRIWVGDKLLYDGQLGDDSHEVDTILFDDPKFFGGDSGGNGGLYCPITYYPGTVDQPADSYLENFQGPDAPRYRQEAHLVFNQSWLGNSPSIDTWKFEALRYPNQLGLGIKYKVGEESNPAEVMYDILTDPELLGLPLAEINKDSFTAAGQTFYDEGQGVSFSLTSQTEISSLLEELERQTDSIVRVNPSTGLWEVKLARDDYSVGDLLTLDDSNIREIESHTRGAWDDTFNQVKIRFQYRTLTEYVNTFALAQDLSNVEIQNRVKTVEYTMQGVRDAELANKIAWRILSQVSAPTVKASMQVDRSIHLHTAGDVVLWTNEELGYDELPMRIVKISPGKLGQNTVKVDLVEDVFRDIAGAFLAPPATLWEPPEDALIQVPSDEQLVFEAPRAFVTRGAASGSSTNNSHRIWCGSRRQSPNEVYTEIHTRAAENNPTGEYYLSGRIYGNFLIASVSGVIPENTASEISSINIVAGPDTVEDFQAAFVPEGLDLDDDANSIGTDLRNLIKVDDELMFVTSTSLSGAVLTLNVYRGVCDTVMQEHSPGAKVYLLHAGGNLTDFSYPNDWEIDVKLLPTSDFDELDIASAVRTNIELDNRAIRPYPPSYWATGYSPASIFETTTSMQSGYGDTPDEDGILVTINRRDFRTIDEVNALRVDAGSIFQDHNTTYEVVLKEGLGTVASFEGNLSEILFTRNEILENNSGDVPSALDMTIKAKHTYDGVEYYSTHDYSDTLTIVDEISSSTNRGVINASTGESNLHTVAETGTYTLEIGSEQSIAVVQISINSGVYVSVILAGDTQGTVVLTAGDTIEMKVVNALDNTTLLLVRPPSASPEVEAHVLFRDQ